MKKKIGVFTKSVEPAKVFAALAGFFVVVSAWFGYNYWSLLTVIVSGEGPSYLRGLLAPFILSISFGAGAFAFQRRYLRHKMKVWHAGVLAISALITSLPFIVDVDWIFTSVWAIAPIILNVGVLIVIAAALRNKWVGKR